MRAVMGRGLVLGAALAIGLAGCGAAGAAPERPGGYDFSLSTGDVLRWPTGSEIGVHIAAASQGAAAGRLRAALGEGIRRWNAVARAGEYRLRSEARLAAADVVLSWADTAERVATAGCPPLRSATAVTTFCLAGDGSRRLMRFPVSGAGLDGPTGPRMVIRIDRSLATQPDRLERVVAHELGHVLGIGAHSPDPSDLMWAGRLSAAAPTGADAATVRRLYRTPPTVRP